MREIFVTNHNYFHHSDSFDGRHYDFPPKERVAVTVEAATHMFGFNLPDKTESLTRLGWATRFDSKLKQWADDPEGVKKLARFAFTKAVMVEEVVTSLDPDDGLPTDEISPATGKKLPKGAVPFLQGVDAELV